MNRRGGENDGVISVSEVGLAVAGAGIRGTTYAMHAVATGRAAIVAVAEPGPARRDAFAERFGVPPARRDAFAERFGIPAERRFVFWVAFAEQL